MAELRPCKSIDDVNEMIGESNNIDVLLLKHSTICPISANAYAEVATFARRQDNVSIWVVLVREDRPVSLHISEATNVTHQSPQVILLKNGKAVWDASHYKISNTTLQQALDNNAVK